MEKKTVGICLDVDFFSLNFIFSAKFQSSKLNFFQVKKSFFYYFFNDCFGATISLFYFIFWIPFATLLNLQLCLPCLLAFSNHFIFLFAFPEFGENF